MPAPPLLLRQRLVGHPLEQVLQEAVLAALRRARIGLEVEHLLADEGREQRIELGLRRSAERGECRPRERLAEHGSVLDHPALLCAEPVEPCCDQRVQRLGHLERLDRPRRPVDDPLLNEGTAVEQHSHGLHGVQRDPFGAFEDLPTHRLRETGDEPVEQVLHRGLGKRLEVDRGQIPARGAPGRPAIEEFGAGERHHEQRRVPGPLEQVLDEVEQRRVRPLHVLEDHRDRVDVGEALDEEAPRCKEVVPLEPCALLMTE